MVRTKNDLRQWIKFFLTGVIRTSENSVGTLKKITDLKASIEKERILLMGKRSKHGLELFHQLFKKPVVTVKDVQNMTGLSPRAANNLVKIFLEKKILIETTDITWFNNRDMPNSFFEIEHSTDIQNSLIKYSELQDFHVNFFIVSDKKRRNEYENKSAKLVFVEIKKRVKFLEYESLIKQYEWLLESQGAEILL